MAEINGDGWWRGVTVAAVESRTPARYFPASFVDRSTTFDPVSDIAV